MLNSVILIGRLTKDPELRYTPNGIAVSTFTLAVNRNLLVSRASARLTLSISFLGVTQLKS
jgi:single stranded DNA-binding protein